MSLRHEINRYVFGSVGGAACAYATASMFGLNPLAATIATVAPRAIGMALRPLSYRILSIIGEKNDPEFKDRLRNENIKSPFTRGINHANFIQEWAYFMELFISAAICSLYNPTVGMSAFSISGRLYRIRLRKNTGITHGIYLCPVCL